MATSNFCNFEASKYYAVGMQTEENEIFDSYYFDDKKKYISEKIDELAEGSNYYTFDSDNVENNFLRSYSGSLIRSIGIDKDFGDITINIICNAVMVSGYYEGANLDIITDIQINGYSYDNYKNFLENFDFTDLEYYSSMPIGMQKIQAKNIIKYVEKFTPVLTEKVENILSEKCQFKLVVSARFSNGETWYNVAS